MKSRIVARDNMENEVKKITVVIGDMHIPVSVTEKEELKIREVEKEINNKVAEIQSRYIRQASEKSLAMAALSLIMQYKSDQPNHDIKSVVEQLDNLQKKISSNLKDKLNP